MYYICLTGDKVKKYENECTEIYDKKDFEFVFTDPISLEYLKEPVYFNNRVYSKSTIIEWLRENDRDPMTNDVILPQEISLIPINILNYLMYAFEEHNDKLIFHSPPNCIRFAHIIGKYISYVNFDDVCKLSILDYIKYLEPDDHDKNFIRNYSLHDYLMTDIHVGNNMDINNIFLSQNGHLMGGRARDLYEKLNKIKENNQTDFWNYDLNSNIKNRIMSNGSMILASIHLIMKNLFEVIHKVSIDKYEPTHYDEWKFRDYVKKNFKLDDNPTKLQARSSAEKYYEQVMKIERIMNDNKSIKSGFMKISNELSNEKLNETLKSFNDNIDDMRTTLSLPFVQKSNMYGQDFSMYDLSNKVIRNITTIKDYCFAGTNLENTIFEKCDFFSSTFVKANLKGTKFIGCSFNYLQEFSGGPFYKTIIDENTSFGGCKLGMEAPKKYFEDLYKDNGLEL